MAKETPKYRPLITVATGIRAQIEANLNALDLHEKLPKEADELGEKLAEAYKLADDLVKRGEAEPEE